jgi:signal transduction histidine kinase
LAFGLQELGAAEPKKKDQAGEIPLHITAARLEADQQERLITFSGQVKAVYGDAILYADQLQVYYQPAPATAAVEIRILYEDFGRMAQAVDRRSRYLRDFAAAVSHEFKTPLSGIQGAVELLHDHEMDPGQRRRFLDNIAADARRLSALVTRLLDLARADMARPQAGLSVDVRLPITKAVDARSSRLAISVMFGDETPRVAVPASTIEMVVSTLLENSRQAGATAVSIRAAALPDRLVVTLADDGPGVAPADAGRVFEPFFTTRRGEGGAGLGLSIARALLAANDATLDLLPTTEGAVFELVMPLAEQ